MLPVESVISMASAADSSSHNMPFSSNFVMKVLPLISALQGMAR
jgi:hypothetical protein